MRRAIIVSIVCFCLGSFGVHAQSLDGDWIDSTKVEPISAIDYLGSGSDTTSVQNEEETSEIVKMVEVLDTAGASAVILNDEKVYTYKFQDDKIIEVITISKEVLIKDINALAEFSQFYFAQGEVEGGRSRESAAFEAGFTIVKPSGERIELDLTNAKENDETVPYVFSAGKNSDVVYYRTAVSNLEIGDVVEFYHQSEFAKARQAKVYMPTELQYEVLGSSYPTLQKSIRIELRSSTFKTRCYSMNGAPEFRYENKRVGLIHPMMILTVKNIPATKSSRFYARLRAEPFVKFQTYFVNIENNYYVSYSDLPYPLAAENSKFGSETSGLRDSDLQNMFKAMPFEQGDNGKIISKIYKRMRKVKERDNYSDLEYGLMLYEIFHDVYFAEFSPAGATAIGDYQFCNVMAVLFRHNRRKLEIVGYIPKNLGSYGDLKFYEELGITIRIKDEVAGEYYYFKPFTLGAVRHVNQVENFTGQTFDWIVAPRLIYQTVQLQSASEDEPSSEANASISAKNLTLDLKNREIQVQSEITYKGTPAKEASSIAVPRISYVTQKQTRNKKKVAIQQAKRALLFERYRGYRMHYYEGDWQNDFTVARYDSLATSSNNNLFTPEVTLQEDLVLDDLLHPVGENFMFDVGELIGGQFHIAESERERTKDISVVYPHKLINTITFKVPEGYAVENVAALNCEFDCDAGLFSATATLDGNIVTIETKKVYKQANLAVENWSPMLQFLDLAHDYTYKKLLLRKL
jgi:hypothetical protein